MDLQHTARMNSHPVGTNEANRRGFGCKTRGDLLMEVGWVLSLFRATTFFHWRRRPETAWDWCHDRPLQLGIGWLAALATRELQGRLPKLR